MNYNATEKQRRKDEYYLTIAEAVARKSTCLRRGYGAIIVKNDEIISTGYNGSPRGCLNCNEVGCMREVLGTSKGDAYNLCASVHAEQNAIISAARRDMTGATLYIVGLNMSEALQQSYGKYADPNPCMLCHRMIINAGITQCIGRSTEYNIDVLDISQKHFMERMQREYRRMIALINSEISMESLRPHSDMEYVQSLQKQRDTATRMLDEHIALCNNRFHGYTDDEEGIK